MASEQALDLDSQVLELRATEGSYASAECQASLATHRETNTERCKIQLAAIYSLCC